MTRITFIVLALAIGWPGVSTAQISPELAREQITVQLPVWEQDTPEQIHLLNSQGQLMDSFQIPEGENSLQIDGSQLPRGLYFLTIQGREKRSTHRIAFQ